MRHLLITGAAFGLTASECSQPVVCDPLPPPIDCSNNPTTSTLGLYVDWRAEWTEVASSLVVRVNLQIYTSRPENNLTFSGDPELTGAVLREVSRELLLLSFDCSPSEGVTTVDVKVPVGCNGEAESLHLKLDVSEPPVDGANVPITVGE